MRTKKPLLAALAVFLCVAGLAHYHLARLAERERAAMNDRTALICAVKADELQSELHHLLDAARLMAAWIPLLERNGLALEAAADAALASFKAAERIGLAPQGVLSGIYPPTGHDGGLGKDLFADTERRFASRESLRTRGGIVTGPFLSSRGVPSLVAQAPVYTQAGEEGSFWGFATALASVDWITRRAALHEVAAQGFVYRLEKGGGTPQERIHVAGAAGEAPDGVTRHLDVPGVRLSLTVAPSRPLPTALDSWPQAVGSLVLAACAAALAWLLAREPEKLRTLAQRRTERLRKVNHRLAREIRTRRQLTRERDASVELGRGMFENSPAVKLLVEPLSLKVADANPAAGRFFGWSRQELTGMALESFTVAPRQTLGRTVAAAMRGDAPPYPGRVRLASGEERDVEIYSGPVRRDGVLLLQSVILDVSGMEQARRELRDSRVRLESIFNAVDSAILEADARGALVLVNQGFADMFGHPRHAALTLRDLASASGRDACEGLHARVMAGEIDRACALVRFARRDGREFWGSACFGALPGEKDLPRGCVASITDVTPLMEARKASEGASEAKSRFLANMSHEIRSPMNAIMGLAELTLRSGLETEQRDNLHRILEASRALLKVLESVLDYSDLESGGLRLNPSAFSPARAVESVIGRYAGRARAKGVELRAEGLDQLPAWLLGDGERLEQVLAALTGNAVKFTAQGEVVVRARARSTGEDAASVGFYVTDTGVGMDRSRLEELSKPFVQGESGMARTFGGAGLGLSIASRLLAIMGSALKVQSEPGKGSSFCFEVELPMASAATREDAPATGELGRGSRELAGRRVLVVDDNELGRLTAMGMLKLAGLSPAGAASGEEALAMLARGGFDAVLMDIQMPGMDGFETLARLRALPGLRSLPVVAVTGHARDEDRRESLAAGMAGHVSKPYTPEALVQALELALAAPLERGLPEAGLDTVRALALLMGNRELYARLLAGFMREYRDAAGLMRAHAARGERGAMRELAFAVRGLASNLGGVRLGEAAVRLEQALDLGTPAEGSPAVVEFSEALEEFQVLAMRTVAVMEPR